MREEQGQKHTPHTPGPWEVKLIRGRQPHRGDIFSACKGLPQKWIAQTMGQEDVDEREANARLISAAPDLLEALRSLLVHFAQTEYRDKAQFRFDERHPLHGRAMAAIAKATSQPTAAHGEEK